ncbi:MAG TPA: hypothetical protein QGG47_17070 [Acidobacteriota bacterium]|nr:hypothetical protein [Acidobacteriota bacterium]
MERSPLALVFLLIAIAFMGLTVLLAILQRRSLRDQAGQVQELLAEARRLAAEERAGERADPTPDDAS